MVVPAPAHLAADPRLAALYATALLDSEPREAFDRLTRMAARLLQAPVALLSLVAHDRQFFLSSQGLAEPLASARQTPLSHSVCQFVAHDRAPLVVEDTRLNLRLAGSSAIGELGVIAYCGIPLYTAEGFAIGSLCVFDGEPRCWSDEQVALLTDLAALCSAEIQLHAAAAARMRSEQWARRQQAILGLIAHDAELTTILDAIARHLEADSTDALCSIVVFDEDAVPLPHGAAPTLGADHERTRAGATGEWPTHPADSDELTTDPRWAPWRHLVLAHGLQTCWTTPITAHNGAPLGICVVYARTAGAANPADRQLVRETTELARIAIERHRMGLRLRRQDVFLQRARMHEALGRLSGVVAHEFNSLLTAMLSSATELRRRMSDRASAQDLDVIEDAARKASMLTARLLAAAGRRYLRPRAVDLTEWIDALRDTIEGDLPAAVRFRLDAPVPGGSLVVPADPAALGEAVLALVDNAVRAMPQGGRLTVRLGAARLGIESEAPVTAEGAVLPLGAYACITVEDTGTGMNEHELSAALDFFGSSGLASVRSDGAVRGFGLPLVAGTVRQTGGHVTARSTPGVGTAITLWLPDDVPAARLILAHPSDESQSAAAPAPAPAHRHPAVASVVAGSRGTVLLVDDEPTIRRVVQRALERAGYRVIDAPDGTAGWERFKANAVDISAVLCDWRMPGLDGRQLRAHVLEAVPGLPVLIMSGYGEMAAPDDHDQIEMLAKPFEIDELIARLHTLVAAYRGVANGPARPDRRLA